MALESGVLQSFFKQMKLISSFLVYFVISMPQNGNGELKHPRPLKAARYRNLTQDQLSLLRLIESSKKSNQWFEQNFEKK